MKLSEKFICATHDRCDFDHPVPSPYLRRTFTLDAYPETAEITICGLGFYRLWINGSEVTKGPLAPYISNTDHICYYDRYDAALFPLCPHPPFGKGAGGLRSGRLV